MSVLACYLEDEGIATTLVSLVRLHSEKVRSPRALWVPFELGRPLGRPNDAALQTRVLKQALGLLESDSGPVVLEDFDHSAETDPQIGWASPIKTSRKDIDLTKVVAIRNALDAELCNVTACHEKATATSGRTTFGVSGLTIAQIARYITSFLGDAPDANPSDVHSAMMALRFCVDDIKTYYTEAAMAGGQTPSSKQLVGWFWSETVASQLLIALRDKALKGEDAKLQVVGRFVAPHAKVVELDLYQP